MTVKTRYVYMWNDIFSRFCFNHTLLIKVRTDEGKRIVIPLSLWAMETTIDSVADLVCVLERFIPGLKKAVLKKINITALDEMSLYEALNALYYILRVLRRCGRVDLVNVQSDDTRVSIKLC